MEILQIVPAQRREVASDDRDCTRIPLACWALVKDDDGKTSVKGLIPSRYQQLRYCDEFEEFLCYVPQGKPVLGHSSGK